MIASEFDGVFIAVGIKHVVATKNFLALGERTIGYARGRFSAKHAACAIGQFVAADEAALLAHFQSQP